MQKSPRLRVVFRPFVITAGNIYLFKLDFFSGTLYWNTPNRLLINGTSVAAFNGTATGFSMDFPGLFDKDGRPINYRDELRLGASAATASGAIKAIYYDAEGYVPGQFDNG